MVDGRQVPVISKTYFINYLWDYTIQNEMCGNRIKVGFFNVIIQDIAVRGTND